MPLPSDPTEVLTRPAPPPHHLVAYGEHPDQVADVRLPAPGDEPAPLVLLVHGGFWREAYDRTHTAAQAHGLVAAGYAVAVLEYRRVGGAGGCPETFDDLASAVERVPGLVAGVAGNAVDVDRLALVGHSAGGHLALWVALRHLLPRRSRWAADRDHRVRGVVALAGVVDLRAARIAGLGDGAVDALVGAQDLADLDPGVLPDPDLTTVLVHGTDDENVPVAISRGYAAAHPAAHLWEVEGVEHFGVIDPLSPAWPRVLQAVELATGPVATRGGSDDRGE